MTWPTMHSMYDNTHSRGYAGDEKRVAIEPYEVRYWCAKFGCTEAQLRAAVRAVGPIAAAAGFAIRVPLSSTSSSLSRN
jgi:hypothetical protein